MSQPRMFFIATDTGATAIGGDIGMTPGSGSADATGASSSAIGTLIAGVQLDPAREFVGGVAGTIPQTQGGGALPIRPDGTSAGAPSPNLDNSRTVEGVFKPDR